VADGALDGGTAGDGSLEVPVAGGESLGGVDAGGVSLGGVEVLAMAVGSVGEEGSTVAWASFSAVPGFCASFEGGVASLVSAVFSGD
jgi:hypothetical protein